MLRKPASWLVAVYERSENRCGGVVDETAANLALRGEVSEDSGSDTEVRFRKVPVQSRGSFGRSRLRCEIMKRHKRNFKLLGIAPESIFFLKSCIQLCANAQF